MNKGISVILFTHNQSDYVQERLISIEKQTLQPNELIIVDDGSTDDTVEEILKFLDNSSLANITKIVPYPVETGKASGRWKHLLDAKYEFTWLIEGDDSSDATFLELSHDLLIKNATAGFSWCWSNFVDERGNHLGRDVDFLISKPNQGSEMNFIKESGLHLGSKILRESLYLFNPFPNLCANLFRTKILLGVFSEFEFEISNLRLAADWFVYAKILEKNDLVVNANALNVFRRHLSANTYRMNLIEHFSEFRYMQTLIETTLGGLNTTNKIRQLEWANHVSSNLGISFNERRPENYESTS